MSTRLEIPDWLLPEPSSSPPPPVDDHRVEDLVNTFIAAKQDALFGAPDAHYRSEGADAVDGAPAITQRLQDLRTATLEQARDDGERAALAPRLDLHLDDSMDGIGRHLAAQQTVRQRRIVATRQALIQRAAELEHDKDKHQSRDALDAAPAIAQRLQDPRSVTLAQARVRSSSPIASSSRSCSRGRGETSSRLALTPVT